MRILLINQYYPPDSSNTAYILGELAEDLATDHQVTVLAGRPSYNADASRFRPEGPRAIRVRSSTASRQTLMGRVGNYASYALLALGRALALPRPDVVVSMTDPPASGVIGALVAARHRCPHVHICHDLYPDIAVALGRLTNRHLIRAWRAVNRQVWSRAAAIVVVGRDMKQRFVRNGVPAAKLSFVPTWSEKHEVDRKKAQDVREQLGWTGRFVVMHAGNIGLAQNLGMLPDVAQRLRAHEDILFVCLGDGAGKPALVREANRHGLANIAFLPHRPKDEAQVLMAAADLHLVSLVGGLYGCAAPSKTYGVMAAGRPFVASVDPQSEPALIVDEFDCGRWVPAGDPAAVAASILELRTSDLDAMGQRCRNAMTTRYERSAGTGAIRQLLERVAGPTGSP
jgi:putative colanic acid biosynthesis glycosyltransferase WcaI